MVARVQKRGELLKLASMWTGLWRVVSANGQHAHGTEDFIVTGQLKDEHVARMTPCADSSLAVTTDLKERLSTLLNGEFNMDAVRAVALSADSEQ